MTCCFEGWIVAVVLRASSCRGRDGENCVYVVCGVDCTHLRCLICQVRLRLCPLWSRRCGQGARCNPVTKDRQDREVTKDVKDREDGEKRVRTP